MKKNETDTQPDGFPFGADGFLSGADGFPFGADGFPFGADGSLDACGLSCPLPLLKAKQGLNRLEAGQVFALVCTDAGSVRDFKVFCEQSGNELLDSMEEDGKYYYRLKKATV